MKSPVEVLADLMRAGRRAALFGPPACGKSSMVHEAARLVGRELVVSTPGIEDKTDYSGCIVPDLGAGVSRVLPLDKLAALLAADRPVLWLADDLGNAETDVQAAYKSLLTKGGRFHKHPLVLPWAASNRAVDRTGVRAMHSSLLTEFDVAFTLAVPGVEDEPGGPVLLGQWNHPDPAVPSMVASWCDWGRRRLPDGSQNMPAEMVAWHRHTGGRTLYQFKPNSDPALRYGDFRTWEAAGHLWNAGLRDVSTLGAAIGKPNAAEFRAFAALAANLPTREVIEADPMAAPVPSESEPGACFLVCSMLAARAEASWAPQLFRYINRLPGLFGALLGRDVYQTIGATLAGVPEAAEWYVANRAIFQTGGTR